MHLIPALKQLGLLGGLNHPVKLSSAEFAEYLATSSKTSARILKSLEDEGYIERRIVPGGQEVLILETGRQLLKKEYEDYRHIFTEIVEENPIHLRGHIVSGLGEGHYYIGQEGYQRQFGDKLGFAPYPGTLNVHLDDLSLKFRDKLAESAVIPISGFTSGERTFGACHCFCVKVEGFEAAVVVPDRTHYPADLLEIISPVKLRDELDLKDGDEVEVTVDY